MAIRSRRGETIENASQSKEWISLAICKLNAVPMCGRRFRPAARPLTTLEDFKNSKGGDSMAAMEKNPRITPFLWFDSNAEEAADFYVSVFKNSRRLDVLRVPADSAAGPKGKVLTVTFELDGQKFTALNGGPTFKFNEAVSFVVRCDSQAEVDEYWGKLTAGGAESQCGWLKDKFGLSWQIVPARLPELVKNPKAMQAMMGMKKIDLEALERAAGS
jgi:predicted 3-demethylubiquinone-9 3-methyltransferase (glyoxalase superfamily)